jgi:hypothetical protein
LLICFWLTSRYTKGLNAEDQLLFIGKFLIIILAVTWFSDNMVTPKIQILNDEENKAILQIMSYIVTTLFGYFLRGNKNEN